MIRPIYLKEAIQLEITNACVYQCANCTRLVGHHEQPYFMDFEYFKECAISLERTAKMIGIMGGEPLLHPQFTDMCAFLQDRFPPAQLGLWRSLPPAKKHLAPVIAETFGAVLPNDHSLPNIYHSPILVSAEDRMKDYWRDYVKRCWLQKAWSASVNPHGAFFCEVAAALDMILDTGTGWDPREAWWLKKPYEYEEQIQALCSKCGVCLGCTPRLDTTEIDDVDEFWYARLKDTSYKIKIGKYAMFQGEVCDQKTYGINGFRRDVGYLQAIGKKFGLNLLVKPNGYLMPVLMV